MGKAVARGAIRFGSLLDEQGCLLRRGLLIPLNEGRFPRISSRLAGHRKHPECGTAPTGLLEGRVQRVGFPGNGALESGRHRAATRAQGRERRPPGMHAAEFWNERVGMMQVWADYLDQLRH
jgi:hypothetical protein